MGTALEAEVRLRINILICKMEYEIAYGFDFWKLSDDERRVVVLTKRLERLLEGRGT